MAELGLLSDKYYEIWGLYFEGGEERTAGLLARVKQMEERIRVLERDNARLSAALFDALAEFDNAGDVRWQDIKRDHSMGTVHILWADASAPKETRKASQD